MDRYSNEIAFFCPRFIHPGCCSGARVHSRALRRSRRLWTFLSFPSPTGLARSADPIVLEQRFYFSWRNLVIFRPRNWKSLGNICFSSANSTDFDHFFWLNFAKSFYLKKWKKIHTKIWRKRRSWCCSWRELFA